MRPMMVFKPNRKRIAIVTGTILSLAMLLFVFTGQDREAIDYHSWQIAQNSPVMDMPKVAYLTFDDGPSTVTAQLLDVLKEKKVPATFFVVGVCGQLEQKDRDILWKRMVDEGHTIGLHVYEHIAYPKLYASGEAYLESLNRLEKEIVAATGAHMSVYRFPAGSNNAYCSQDEYNAIVNAMNRRGMEYYDWNVDGKDAIGVNTTAQSVINHVVREAKKLPNPVILLHDIPSCKGSVEAVGEIITQLRAAGYTFDTIEHLPDPIHQTLRWQRRGA